MTIDRRTIVLGLPAMAGLLLTGCQPGDDPTAATPTTTSSDGRASAQALAGTSVSGSVYVSQTYLVTVGAFPTSASVITPSASTYQACVNGRELHVLLRDSVTVSGVSSIRTILLKLITPSSNWQAGSLLTIDMASGASGNNGSEGFIYHNPDYASTTPATAKYAYQMSAGSIIVSIGGSGTDPINYVTLEFSPSSSTMVKATPLASSTTNSATGYIYIPNVNSRIVTLKARSEVEATT